MYFIVQKEYGYSFEAQILAELKNIGQQLSNIDRQLSELEKKQAATAREFNAIPRLYNLYARDPVVPLCPLWTPQNEEVADFPLRLGDVDTLTSAELDNLFRQFNLPTITRATEEKATRTEVKVTEVKAMEVKATEVKATEVKATEVKATEVEDPEVEDPEVEDPEKDRRVHFKKHIGALFRSYIDAVNNGLLYHIVFSKFELEYAIGQSSITPSTSSCSRKSTQI
ncbi:hypothetical protein RUND412_005521 [Rhizina undulata]